MNPLEQNPKARKVVYTVFWVLSLALLGLQVGFGAAEVHQPTWLAVALAVFTAVSAAVGYTAYANTSAPADPPQG